MANDNQTALMQALSEIESVRKEQRAIWQSDDKLKGYPTDILDTVFAVIRMRTEKLLVLDKAQILDAHNAGQKRAYGSFHLKSHSKEYFDEKYGTDGK